MFHVSIMQAVVTACLSLVALTPSWCDWCGALTIDQRPLEGYDQTRVCSTCEGEFCAFCFPIHDCDEILAEGVNNVQ